jgi:hypothetical protein
MLEIHLTSTHDALGEKFKVDRLLLKTMAKPIAEGANIRR